jgi:hypothetical protein
VDLINGRPGNSLKLDGSTLIVNTLRVGFEKDGAWRVFGLRHDFHPAGKVQTEDDITASVVAPAERLPESRGLSRKFCKTASAASFKGPTTPSIAATTGRPKRISRHRGPSSPTSSRLTVRMRANWSMTPSVSMSFPHRCRS